MLPGKGVPIALQRLMPELMGMAAEDSRSIAFDWQALPDQEFFRIDGETGNIVLNETYRHDVLVVLPARRNDVPLVKFLLYFILKQGLHGMRTSGKRDRERALLNRMLIEAAKLGLG